MKKIAALILTIAMLVSVIAPMGALAETTDSRKTVYLYNNTKADIYHEGEETLDISKLLNTKYNMTGDELVKGTVDMEGTWSGPSGAGSAIHNGIFGEATPYTSAKDSYVRFCADGLEAGLYKAEFLYIRQAGSTSGVGTMGVSVKHKLGNTETFELSPNHSTREWMSIGIFNFTGGSKDEYIEIKNLSGTIRVSSVRFIPVDSDNYGYTYNLAAKLYSHNGGYLIGLHVPAGANVGRTPAWLDANGNAEIYGSFSVSHDSGNNRGFQDAMFVEGLETSVLPILNATADTNNQGKYVKFFPTNIPGGKYKVKFFNYCYSAKSEIPPIIDIKDKNGNVTEKRYTAQFANKSWVDLGVYEFNGGTTNEYVKIMNDASGMVRVSAVMFEPVVDTVVTIADTNTATNFGDAAAWEVVSNNANLKGPKGENVVSTTANDSITFKPAAALKAGFYDISFLKLFDDEDVVRPTVKFEIKYGDTEIAEHIVNFTEDDTKTINEYLDLGCYNFEGTEDEYVKVTKLAGDGALNASTVKFANAAKSEARGIDRGEGIIIDSDFYGDKHTAYTDVLYRGPLGNASRKLTDTPATSVAAYHTQHVPGGLYDVYWYTIVDEDGANTSDININVYHDGLRGHKVISNKGLAVGTKKWTYIGKYNFTGNARNEYIAAHSPSGSKFLAGGVKFVPAEEEVEEEVIYITARDTDKIDTHGFTFDSGTESGAISDTHGNKTYYRNESGAEFTFKTDSVPAGKYHVEYYSACYNQDVREDASASIIVKSNGNKIDVIPYDNTNGGSLTSQWIDVGDFEFTNTKGEGVTLRGNDVNPGTSLRISEIRLTKIIDEFYVAPAMTVDDPAFAENANATVSLKPGAGQHGQYAADGMFQTYVKAEGVSYKYYLPDHGAKTRAGKYEVYTINLQNSQNVTFNVSSAATNEVTTGTYVHVGGAANSGKWSKVGEFNFKGGSNGEYIEFVTTTATANTRMGGVKFVYVPENAPEATEPTGKFIYDVQIADSAKVGGIFANYINNKGEVNPTTDAVSVTASIKNDTTADAEVLPEIIVAYYSADGETLIGTVKLTTEAKSLKAGETAYYFGKTDRIRLYENVGMQFKAFVWDAATLTPFIKPVTTKVVDLEVEDAE